MKSNKYIVIVSFLFLLILQSCGINSDLMLKTPKDYPFAELDIDSANQSKNEYIIHVDDIVKFQFFTNNGSKVLDIVAGSIGENNGRGLNTTNAMSYVIKNDSLVKLPVIDEVNIVGMTISESEKYLQEKYSEYYVDPFIQISVTNKRVIIFPGSGGDAQVIYLKNNNTTLLEALALSGGITDRGRAKRIKLIRNVGGERKVFLIDLSTIEGLKYTDLIVQNGDYIYVEPTPELGKEILKEIAPIVSIISSTALVISIINAL